MIANILFIDCLIVIVFQYFLVEGIKSKDYKTVWQVIGFYVAVFVISLHIYFRSV